MLNENDKTNALTWLLWRAEEKSNQASWTVVEEWQRPGRDKA